MGLPLLLLASILPTSASADEPPATSIDSLTAVAGISTVAVSGNGTFTAPAVEIGVDGTNDHTGSQAPLPSGTDLTVAKIRALDPETLRFELQIANMPSLGGTPELVNYVWPFIAGSAEYELQAHYTATAREINDARIDSIGTPNHTLNTCTPNETTGGMTCATENIEGEFTGNSVVWFVPKSMVGLTEEKPKVFEGAAIASSLSFSGMLWYANGNGGDTMFAERAFTFPTATVLGTIVDADVADADAVPTTPLAVTGLGDFSGELEKPALPGLYKVVVKACFGAGNCAVASTPLTIGL
ncbi:MAG: hypothetical protein GEU71_02560 [Actinobacteria bacterium]|nr:hypothetical protein [Actinomycetota bacterium]